EQQYHPEGFEWIDFSDEVQSVIVFLRKGKQPEDRIMVICNFTPETRDNYRVGVAREGNWEMMINTDDKKYGGSGYNTTRFFKTTKDPYHGRDQSFSINLPPPAMMPLKISGF